MTIGVEITDRSKRTNAAKSSTAKGVTGRNIMAERWFEVIPAGRWPVVERVWGGTGLGG